MIAPSQLVLGLRLPMRFLLTEVIPTFRNAGNLFGIRVWRGVKKSSSLVLPRSSEVWASFLNYVLKLVNPQGHWAFFGLHFLF